MAAKETSKPAALRIERLLPLLILISLVMSGNGMIAPMLSLYAQQFGVGGTLIGMVVTLFGVGRLFANVPAGFLSERFGRRPFMCLGPALIALGAVGAALAESFEWLLIWRFVQGFGSGIYMTVSAVVLAEVSRAGERGRTMALYQGALLFGAGIGPAIGGFLAAHLGFRAPFWAYAGVAGTAFAFALLTFEEPEARAEAKARAAGGEAPSLRGLLGEFHFLVLCAITFGVFLTRTASQWLLIPLAAQKVFGLPVEVIGLALATITTANFLMLPIVGPVIDRIGARMITIWATVGCGAALLLLGLATDIRVFWAAIVLLGLANGFNGPSVAAALADRIPPGLYGPAIGLQRAIGDTGMVAGPVLVGVLYDLTAGNQAIGLAANAALMLAAGALFAFGSRARPA